MINKSFNLNTNLLFTNNTLHFLNLFTTPIAALLESTVNQQEPPQKVHARGEQNMFENSYIVNYTNLLTQTTPFIFSIASLLQ